VRVLAIDPTSRGFGFIVVEGPSQVVDWGVRSGRAASIEREQQLLQRFNDLLSQYRPKTVILEDMRAPESRRRTRVRLLLGAMENFARWHDIRVRRIPQSKVKKVFATFHAMSKHDIACIISQQLPELSPWLPQPRKPWRGEDYRMASFNAAALALTYFYARLR
jgi:Holliday junction resolvasome RuvABC endonuclease subunit